MNTVSNLKVSFYKDGWFALENQDMNPVLYSQLINIIEKVYNKEYEERKARSASKRNEIDEDRYINKVNKNNRLVLFIKQRKVPNIIKNLVQEPNHDIQVKLTGINPQKEVVSRIIAKPFVASEVTELVPFYHGVKATNNQNNDLKTKRAA